MERLITEKEEIESRLKLLNEITKEYLTHLEEWEKKEQPWINKDGLKKQIEQLKQFRSDNLDRTADTTTRYNNN